MSEIYSDPPNECEQGKKWHQPQVDWGRLAADLDAGSPPQQSNKSAESSVSTNMYAYDEFLFSVSPGRLLHSSSAYFEWSKKLIRRHGQTVFSRQVRESGNLINWLNLSFRWSSVYGCIESISIYRSIRLYILDNLLPNRKLSKISYCSKTASTILALALNK